MQSESWQEIGGLSSRSGLSIGDRGAMVIIYQALMGVKETGLWTDDNEREYQNYSHRENWNLIMEAIEEWPSWFDIGPDPDKIVIHTDLFE